MGRSRLNAQDLQHALARMGMVQEDLAVVLGVRQSQVSRWLSGKTAVPAYVEAWMRAAHPDVLSWLLENPYD